jgi:glycosyltransferase involved in cell wall biosynthesis
MHKVLYIVPQTTTFAGMERVIDSICDELAAQYRDTFSIHVLYTTAYAQIVDAERNYTKVIRAQPGRANLIRNVRNLLASENYSLIVIPQVEPTALFWFCMIGLRRPFAMHLHGNPRLEKRSRKAAVMFFLMRWIVLARLAIVFGTSPRQLAAFAQDYPSDRGHVWVPNPARRFEPVVAEARPVDDPVRFVCVGRFAFQKGQDILIRIFAELLKLRPNARLSLVGYGTDEELLKALIRELALEGKVSLDHHPDSPAVPLANSDVFLSGARWEGWSLAICEALRFGLPVIAFDCEFGPSDIIVDDRIGQLVAIGDNASFLQAMVRYHDTIAAERRHADFRKRYVEKFSIENVVHEHAAALTAGIAAAARHANRSWWRRPMSRFFAGTPTPQRLP